MTKPTIPNALIEAIERGEKPAILEVSDLIFPMLKKFFGGEPAEVSLFPKPKLTVVINPQLGPMEIKLGGQLYSL